jgi:hypothetical protein
MQFRTSLGPRFFRSPNFVGVRSPDRATPARLNNQVRARGRGTKSDAPRPQVRNEPMRLDPAVRNEPIAADLNAWCSGAPVEWRPARTSDCSAFPDVPRAMRQGPLRSRSGVDHGNSKSQVPEARRPALCLRNEPNRHDLNAWKSEGSVESQAARTSPEGTRLESPGSPSHGGAGARKRGIEALRLVYETNPILRT